MIIAIARKRRSSEPDEGPSDPTPAKKTRKTAKFYVPQLRSGPYAILLALASIGETDIVSKQQLIELAQPHCDASFVVPKDTTSFHTAWSSMKTLLNKDLVKETRGPQRRYSLTDEGWEVAAKMKSVGRGKQEELVRDAGQKIKASQDKPPTVTLDISDDIGGLSGHDSINGRAPLADRKDHNAQCNRSPSGKRLGGAVIDKPSMVIDSSKIKANQKSAKTSTTTSSCANTKATSKGDRGLVAEGQAGKDDEANAPCHDNVDFIELLSSSPPVPPPPLRPRQPSILPSLDRPSVPRDFEPSREAPQQPRSTAFIPPTFRAITLQPSTFTIELILDNREIRSREDRTYIETQLITKGIRPLVRTLPLGDFLWVAKCEDSSLLSRYGEEGDLIALDYIIERKRLDDLIGSIKDGRFHEQKFRLRKSGVKHVVYLVEEIGISQEMKNKYWPAVQTAIASTQVIDGFTVKRTRGLDESIRYLARMTNVLKGIYEVSDLSLSSKDSRISSLTFTRSPNPFKLSLPPSFLWKITLHSSPISGIPSQTRPITSHTPPSLLWYRNPKTAL